MFNTRIARVGAALALVMALSLSPRVVDDAITGVVDPCNSSASSAAGVLFACPAGDGDQLAAGGLTINVTILDNVSAPVPGVLASDIWVVGCADLLVLCGGSGAISASGPTDANGQTTITGDLAAGGCDGALRVVWSGMVIGAGVCGQPCLPIQVRSADINGSLYINLVDFAAFGAGYTSPPKPYNACIDYTAPFGTVTLPDFAKYGAHNNHTC